MNRIKQKKLLSENVCQMTIEAPEIARKRRAGQFVVLKVNETGERIPLTIVDSDLREGTIEIIFQIVGKTTAMMADLAVGDTFQDVQAPWETQRRSRTTAAWFVSVAAWGRGDLSHYEGPQRGWQQDHLDHRCQNQGLGHPGAGDATGER